MIYETVYKGQTVRTTSYDEAWAAAKSIYGTGKVKQINKAK